MALKRKEVLLTQLSFIITITIIIAQEAKLARREARRLKVEQELAMASFMESKSVHSDNNNNAKTNDMNNDNNDNDNNNANNDQNMVIDNNDNNPDNSIENNNSPSSNPFGSEGN